MGFKTPVLFLIFNRPSLTALVFKEIRKQQPEKLYIAADGPRTHIPGEQEACTLTRKQVIDLIDWKCSVQTLFRDTNLGCGRAVSESINWFFGNEEEGIILEDDCLPHATFFSFCEEMLSKYRHNEQIMHIGGINLQRKNMNANSYYFSRYIHIWGWATWRRAWQHYHFDLPEHNPYLIQQLQTIFPRKKELQFWTNNYDKMARKLIDTWDIQWSFACYEHNGMAITPAVNLISNLGFGPGATHTQHDDPLVAALPLVPSRTVRHPAKIKINQRADRYTFNRYFGPGTNLFTKTRFSIGQRLPIIKKIYLNLVKNNN